MKIKCSGHMSKKKVITEGKVDAIQEATVRAIFPEKEWKPKPVKDWSDKEIQYYQDGMEMINEYLRAKGRL